MNNISLTIQTRISESLIAGRKSIAVSTIPGMGLTTILSNLALEIDEKRFVPVNSEVLMELWKKYYNKFDERRFIIHEATIDALLASTPLALPPDKFNSQNLVSFLQDTDYSKDTFIVLDNFDELPDELCVIILDEVKFFEDNKSQDQYSCLKTMHFLLGGYIDFNSLYAGKFRKGVSPATNFEQFYPNDFILTDADISQILSAYFPNIEQDKLLNNFIREWCDGYLHYIIEFCKWLGNRNGSNANLSIHELMLKLKRVVEENREIALYKYCLDGWEKIRNNALSIDLLKVALGSGYVICNSIQARQLASLGFLIQKDPTKDDQFHIPNKLISLYIRQRLAELELVMPVSDGGGWVLKSLNIEAYSLLVEMENCLRNYIGDRLINYLDGETIDEALGKLGDLLDHDHQQILIRLKNTAEKRRKDEGLLFDTGIKDCILSYLDFSDLGQIIAFKEDLFPPRLGGLLSKSIIRLNSLRNRIAHNRPITKSQIESLSNEWNNMQRVMSLRNP